MAGVKNKEKKNAGTNPNAWMVTFGDLIMLLLTFFVLLLTMKSVDASKTTQMFEQFIGAGGPFEHMGVTSEEGDNYGVKSIMIHNSEMLKNALELVEGVDHLPTKESGLENLKKIINITDDNRGVVVSMESDHLFMAGQAEIRRDRLFVLEAVGKLLRHASNDIIVMGHTDNIPLRAGSFDSNYELSFYRSLSVYYYLTGNMRLKPKNLAVGGYGDKMPMVSNNTRENRSKNRRVEFILRKPK